MNSSPDPLEARLTNALGSVAQATPMSDDWEAIVERIDGESSTPEVRERQWWLFAAAAVVAVLLGGYLLIDVGTVTVVADPASGDFVLPGEKVLREDPLSVIAAAGPGPRFDTTDLGQEITFEPITTIDDEIEQILELAPLVGPQRESAYLSKATLVGRLGGTPIVTMIIDGPDIPNPGNERDSSNLRIRAVWAGNESYRRGFATSVLSLDLIVNRSPDLLEIGGVQAELPRDFVEWDYLPERTAVVTYEDDNRRWWMRPRGGLVAFPAEFDDGEWFTLVALDSSGNEIGRVNQQVDYPGNGTAAFVTESVGDRMGVVPGTDGEGSEVRIEPDGKTKIFLVGAPWCEPCNEQLSDVVDLLGQKRPDADIFAVSVDVIRPWPSDPRQLLRRFVPRRGSLLTSFSDAPPFVVVLDGDNRVVGTIDGFDLGLINTALSAGE